MSPSEATNASTRKGWRDLGFFYDYDEINTAWRFIGSKSGLGKFRDLLLKYTEDPKNQKKSEHDHYGPYMYLEIMTWDSPGIDNHCIQGTLADLRRLGDIVEAGLKNTMPNNSFVIRDEYVKGAKASLIFEIKEEAFDPASADPILN